MVGSTAVLPTPKQQQQSRHSNGCDDSKDASAAGSPTSTSEYDSPKTPGGMTAQRMQCFKTKRCRFWLESRCTRGDRCTYAHTDVELRIPPDLTKTKICTRWKRGTCDKEAGECAYAHGMEDLREAVTPSTTTNTGRNHVSTEGLSFGVPPPATKLRDSPPYSSRSCQTISSTASTRYTSRRDSDSSTIDGQHSTPTQQGIKRTVSSKHPPPSSISSSYNNSPSPTASPAPPVLPSTGSYPSKPVLGPQQTPAPPTPSAAVAAAGPECSAISGALSSAAEVGEMTPEPTDSTSGRTSSGAFAQFYAFNAHYSPSSRVRARLEEPFQHIDRWTPDELLLAVLTVPYYD